MIKPFAQYPLGISQSEEKKTNVFKLPISQAVFVPSTRKGQVKIPESQFRSRIREVKIYLAKTFGGYTEIKGSGGYVGNSGNLIKEKIVKVVSFSTEHAYVKNKNRLVKKLRSWCKEWGQESIGYEKEGDMYYIS